MAALVFAALALCSCGGKSSSSGSGESHTTNTVSGGKTSSSSSAQSNMAKTVSDGKWNCTDIPENMNLEQITLEIKDGSFVYTTVDSKTTAVAQGSVKETGSNTAMLYIEKQKKIQNSDKKLISQIDVEQSIAESQAVNVTFTDENNLTLKAVTLELKFERVSK